LSWVTAPIRHGVAPVEKMLSAQPLADDVTATPGELGGVPVLNIETGRVEPRAPICPNMGRSASAGQTLGKT
jgi:hypothetical protein